MQEKELPEERRQKCEIWTRVMGYHRPISEFNPGKQSEQAERKHFREDAISVDIQACSCCSREDA